MGRKLQDAEFLQDIPRLLSKILLLLDEGGLMCTAAHVSMAMDAYDAESSEPASKVGSTRHNFTAPSPISE